MLESDVSETEAQRLSLQVELDAERTAAERNLMGQFATPPALADDVMRFAVSLHNEKKIRFLEPSCGSGSFFSALVKDHDGHVVESATGIELDERFAAVASSLWSDRGLRVLQGDFFERVRDVGESVSLLVANPPYVRHHHMHADYKAKLGEQVTEELRMKVSGLSGLYVYFVLLAHKLLAPGAVSAWLIPSEFMDTNYGRCLRQYLAERVTINRIHRFDPEDTQFDDALVTSAVVVFTNEMPAPDHSATFTQGGSTCAPEQKWSYPQSELRWNEKWGRRFSDRGGVAAEKAPRFDEFFKIRRGVATGGNGFFIIPREEADRLGIKSRNLVPIMPGSRYVKQDAIEADEKGYPELDRKLALLRPNASTIESVREDDPALAGYLDGVDEKIRNAYLVKNRKVWFQVEKREPAPVLMTYMGRGRIGDETPFRFILNKSKAIATNVYLMLYPVGELKRALESGALDIEAVYRALQSVTTEEFLDGGRFYGGGLRKVEPKELAAMNAQVIANLLPDYHEQEEAPRLF